MTNCASSGSGCAADWIPHVATLESSPPFWHHFFHYCDLDESLRLTAVTWRHRKATFSMVRAVLLCYFSYKTYGRINYTSLAEAGPFSLEAKTKNSTIKENREYKEDTCAHSGRCNNCSRVGYCSRGLGLYIIWRRN